MTDVLDPFGRIDEEMSRMRRREPVLRSILARIPSFADVEEVPVTQEEFDTLLDGEELPTGTVLTVWGKPVIVRGAIAPVLLRASAIAKRLGITRQHAAQVIKTIPGAFRARVTPCGREVWKVDEQAFELWKAGYRFPPLTNGTGIAK